jgi:hypothetical protein
LRGFTKEISLFSVFALLSALFSRIDLPAFLAALLFGDFPDIGITPFHALRYPIPYLLLFIYPVPDKPASAAACEDCSGLGRMTDTVKPLSG